MYICKNSLTLVLVTFTHTHMRIQINLERKEKLTQSFKFKVTWASHTQKAERGFTSLLLRGGKGTYMQEEVG